MMFFTSAKLWIGAVRVYHEALCRTRFDLPLLPDDLPFQQKAWRLRTLNTRKIVQQNGPAFFNGKANLQPTYLVTPSTYS